jgi:Do/DeqQ family serine protease
MRPGLIAALFCAALSGEALAQARVAPQTREEVRLSFAPTVRAVTPAVLNVYGSRVEKTRRRAAADEFFRRFFGGEGDPGPPRDRVQRSLGSGVIVDRSGLVVTNNHVIENMTEVRVALTDRREFEAEIVLRDPRTDLAILRIKGAGQFPALEIGDSEALEVGDLVLAVGNPFGVGQTVTQGIVSALARTNIGAAEYGFFIQTDAAINPGNSGGALVDLSGKLVGINTAIFSQSGGNIGIGFAVPASMVRAVVDSARSGGLTVRRPWLGASLQSLAADLADGLKMDRPTGALVAAVRDESPAQEAGAEERRRDPRGRGPASRGPGELRLPVRASRDIRFRPDHGARNGRRETLTVRLQPPPERPARDAIRLRARSPLAGANVLNVSPAVADELQLDWGSGVVIEDVQEGSAARARRIPAPRT